MAAESNDAQTPPDEPDGPNDCDTAHPADPVDEGAEQWLDYMRLDEIQKAESNAKRHAKKNIQSSITRLGAGEPPMLDERTGRLVAGHGRLDAYVALRKAGRPKDHDGPWPPRGVKVDDDGMWKIAVIRGWRSEDDHHAEAYLLASNNLTTKGGWDDAELAEALEGLRDFDPTLMSDVTGFVEADLQDLLNSLSGIDEGDDELGSGDALEPSDEDKYTSQYGVIVECSNAGEQEDTYDALRALGYQVRVVTV